MSAESLLPLNEVQLDEIQVALAGENVIVVLTDHATLAGTLAGFVSGIRFSENGEPESYRKLEYSRDGFLQFYYGHPFHETSIYIPYGDVAGIHRLSYSQKKVFSIQGRWAGNYFVGSIEEALFKATVEKATRRNYEIVRHSMAYKLGSVDV